LSHKTKGLKQEEQKMKAKTIIGLLLIGFILISACSKKKTAWVAALEEHTVYFLSQNVNAVDKHIDQALQMQKQGKRAKAAEELKQAKRQLEEIKSFYIPLINAKSHIAAAYRLSERNDITRAKDELAKARNQISISKSELSGATLQSMNKLMADTEGLEKELVKMTDRMRVRFIQIAGSIDTIITNKGKK
jgi:cellobiose-specific phosphotransferase system component IIA